MVRKIVSSILISMLLNFNSWSQFPGPVGSATTTAIYKDSSVFINWATNSSIIRGFQNCANTSAGFTTIGDETSAVGIAGTNGVVSLGDGGSAILQFTRPILNGVGPDFAVFENAFSNTFLELAFVEVSSDGINFTRFPAISNAPTDQQYGTFSADCDATLTYNLAGKYAANYGTPFDLEELVGTPNLDLNAITHVKIIDVVGSIDSSCASYDSQNNAVNDPFPTEFASGGFDLDAVGVIHQLPLEISSFSIGNLAQVFPNPFKSELNIQIPDNEMGAIIILKSDGSIVYQNSNCFGMNKLDTEFLPSGFYLLEVTIANSAPFRSALMKE